MKNLLLNWKWFNEDGTPGTFMWAICTIAAVVVFATIIFLIYRLYGRNLRNKKNQAQQGETIVNNVSVVSPTFEKRDDNQQLEFYDPTKAQQEISEYLDMSMAEIYGVITFYSRFTLNPKGKYSVSVCMGTACYVRGSQAILDELTALLGIEAEDCTEDGQFSLTACRCG